MGILGYGSIGRETARLCQAYNMEVLALKRNPRQIMPTRAGSVPGVSNPDGSIPRKWFGPEQRGELLAAMRLRGGEPAADCRGTASFSGTARIRNHEAGRLPGSTSGVAAIINQQALIEALKRRSSLGKRVWT